MTEQNQKLCMLNIVIEIDGRLVWISAEELRRQASEEAKESINPEPPGMAW